MQAREQKAVGSEIRVREQRVADLTEAYQDMLNGYGSADRITMTYRDMLTDAQLELMRYKEQFGL